MSDDPGIWGVFGGFQVMKKGTGVLDVMIDTIKARFLGQCGIIYCSSRNVHASLPFSLVCSLFSLVAVFQLLS